MMQVEKYLQGLKAEFEASEYHYRVHQIHQRTSKYVQLPPSPSGGKGGKGKSKAGAADIVDVTKSSDVELPPDNEDWLVLLVFVVSLGTWSLP